MDETRLELMYLAPSWVQILIVVVLVVLLFGRGKISELMSDVAKGIKSFKKGLSDEEEVTAKKDPPKALEPGQAVKADARQTTGGETKAG